MSIIFIFCFFVSCSINKKITPSTALSGLKLWENNCSRCHNQPDVDNFSDREWDIISSHMRLRAYLSQNEIDEIVKFLKTIN